MDFFIDRQQMIDKPYSSQSPFNMFGYF